MSILRAIFCLRPCLVSCYHLICLFTLSFAAPFENNFVPSCVRFLLTITCNFNFICAAMSILSLTSRGRKRALSAFLVFLWDISMVHYGSNFSPWSRNFEKLCVKLFDSFRQLELGIDRAVDAIIPANYSPSGSDFSKFFRDSHGDIRVYTVSHGECGHFRPCIHEMFEKFEMISTPTGSWIRSCRRPHQLPVGVEIISNFSKFHELEGRTVHTLDGTEYI